MANLPYNVATPVVSNLLVHPELRPELMVVTIQLELAERMRAAPASPDYGALSILIQAMGEVSIVRTLSPKVFWPQPKVESAVVKITPDPAKIEAIGDLPWFHSILRKIFMHRRKNLRGVLHGLFRDKATKPDIDALLETIGLNGMIRAEAMDVDEFVSLAHALKARFGEDRAEETEDEEVADDEAESDVE